MAKKKRRHGSLGVESEPNMFESFGPKKPPSRPLTPWERVYGEAEIPGESPVTPPSAPPPPPKEPRPGAFIHRPHPSADASRYFDIRAIWAYVLSEREKPESISRRPGGITREVPVERITDPPDPGDRDSFRTVLLKLAAFFGLPEAEVKYRNEDAAWNQYLDPFITELERQMNLERPPGIPGQLYLTADKQGGFWIAYFE